MNKENLTFFLSWLSTASGIELQTKRDVLLTTSAANNSEYRVDDINLLIKLIDEEITTRVLVQVLGKK